MNNSSDSDETIDDYIQQINEEYQAAQALVTAEVNDSGNLAKDKAELAQYLTALNAAGIDLIEGDPGADPNQVAEFENDIATDNIQDMQNLLTYMLYHRSSGGSHDPTRFFPIIENIAQDEYKNQTDYNTAKANLEKIDPDMVNMDSALSSLQNALSNNKNPISSDLFQQDLALLNKRLQTLLQAMLTKLQADKFQALIEGDAGGNLSTDELEQFAAEMIQYQSQEVGVLSQLVTDLANDFKQYHTDYENAKVDYNRFNVLDILFDRSSATSSMAKDQIIMNNAEMMEGALAGVIGALSPELSSIMPVMTQIKVILQEVFKKLEKIINDAEMTPKQKVGALLALMMFALGIFQQVAQEVQSQKAKNEQMMSQANCDSSEMNIIDAEANQKIQQELEANAKVMKNFMLGMQIIMGTLMTLAAPGLGTALLMAGATVAETTGAMDTLADKIASAFHVSNLVAQVIVGALEVAVTVGGGLLADKALSMVVAKTLAESAVATAKLTTEIAVKEAAEEAATEAGKTGDQMVINAAKTTITQTVDKATQTAAIKTVEAFFNQPAASLLKLALTGSFTTSLRSAVQKAADIAAIDAIEASATIAKLAARGVATTEKEIIALADQAAYKAVADAASIDLETAQKFGRSDSRRALSRALWTMGYNFGTSDYLNNMIIALHKKCGGKEDDQSLQNGLVFINILKSFIQMLTLSLGSGMANMSTFNSTNITKLADLLMMVPQAGNVAAAIGQYDVSESQGGAIEALTKTEGLGEILEAFLRQIQKDSNISMQQFTAQQTQDLQGLQAMSAHLQDGDRAGIQVLIAGAS